jgi:hypothetical protein
MSENLLTWFTDRSRETQNPSGRPVSGEFADYAKPDIDRVESQDAVSALATQAATTASFLMRLTDEAIAGLTYAPGKWTVKQVIGHVSDDERIFAYRALCIARGETRPLEGFDEKLYAEFSECESRPVSQLVADYCAVRFATITLFERLSAEAWTRRGVVNGYSATPRGLAFHIAGHELRHMSALRETYGLNDVIARLRSSMGPESA